MLLFTADSSELNENSQKLQSFGHISSPYSLFSPVVVSLFKQLYLHADLVLVIFLVNHDIYFNYQESPC